MFRVSKRMEIAGSHRLELPYESPCTRLHGHNWIITVHCESDSLDENGMVIDFQTIKKIIHGKLDHQNLNEVFDFNPTAENIAYWISEEINKELRKRNTSNIRVVRCYQVDVQESEGNVATYRRLMHGAGEII